MIRRLVVGAVVMLALGLTGCAQQDDAGYPRETSDILQSGVLAVTEAAAADDPQAALARLDELHAALLDRRARGTIDQARFDSVSAAIELVRADLLLAIDELTTGDATAEPTDTGPGNSDKPGKPGKPDKTD